MKTKNKKLKTKKLKTNKIVIFNITYSQGDNFYNAIDKQLRLNKC